MKSTKSGLPAEAVEAYNQEKSKAQQEGKLNADSALTARVRNVSQRLIPGTAVFRPDAVNWIVYVPPAPESERSVKVAFPCASTGSASVPPSVAPLSTTAAVIVVPAAGTACPFPSST